MQLFRYITLALAILHVTSSFAQDQFRNDGKFSALSGDFQVYLTYKNELGQETKDSTKLQSGMLWLCQRLIFSPPPPTEPLDAGRATPP